MDNNERFMQICSETVAAAKKRDIIGRLQEKTLHAALKKYIEPDESCHEIRIGNFYADAVMRETGEIIEIQTRAFNRLREKLSYFLEEHAVTVVYPIPHHKWILWLDPDSGEIVGTKRKSPKTGSFYQAFPELYKIKPFLCHPRLHLRFMLIDMTEYKLLDGYGSDKKKGATHYDRIPTALVDEIELRGREDYAKLLPGGLPEVFTSRDFRRCMPRGSGGYTQPALNILHHLGTLQRIGKAGNLYQYRIAIPESRDGGGPL